MSVFRHIVLAAAACLAAVIAVRVFSDPFSLVLPVQTPLNAEGFFGLAITVLLLAADKTGPEPRPGVETRRTALVWIALAVAAFSVLCLVRSLAIYFLSDDFILVTMAHAGAGNLRHLFTTGGGDGFYRPIVTVYLALESAWASFDSVRWHASGLALHTLNSVLVALLALRLRTSSLGALFAGALFAVHGTRPEAAVWIAARFDLVATFFVLSAFLLFVESGSRSGILRLALQGAALICSVLAVLSKESAYIFPFLLLLYVLSEGHRAGLRKRDVLPFFLAAGLVFAYRWSLFRGIGGYIVSQTGQPQALSFGLPTTLKAVAVRLWAALYFPINWSAEPSGPMGVLAAGYLAALGWLALRSRPSRRLWVAFGWVMLAIVPPLSLLGFGPDLRNCRVLYLPSAGFCIFLAIAVDGLGGRFRYLVAALILSFNVVALHHNLDLWQYASAKVKDACFVAQADGTGSITVWGLPTHIRGVPSFANGFRECAEIAGRRRIEVHMDPSKSADALVWDRATETLVRAKN